jgi:hypothetical protein
MPLLLFSNTIRPKIDHLHIPLPRSSQLSLILLANASHVSTVPPEQIPNDVWYHFTIEKSTVSWKTLINEQLRYAAQYSWLSTRQPARSGAQTSFL